MSFDDEYEWYKTKKKCLMYRFGNLDVRMKIKEE